MLKEVGLDESHSCKQGSGGGRFAWLGGLLSTRSNAVEQPRLFSSFRFADPEAAWGQSYERWSAGHAHVELQRSLTSAKSGNCADGEGVKFY
jgi:hypothetical protein